MSARDGLLRSRVVMIMRIECLGWKTAGEGVEDVFLGWGGE